MTNVPEKVTVYYDGSCPGCVRDRRRYEKLAGKRACHTEWVDITGRQAELEAMGIDSKSALRELHVRDATGQIHRELDAYILLMRRTLWLKPVALLIGLPVIKPFLAWLYHRLVDRRLKRSGRL